MTASGRSSLVAIVISVAALLVAAFTQRQAADAGATAQVARSAAEAPRPPCVEIDQAPLDARLEQLELGVDKARACAEYLWLVGRQLVVSWPARPRIPEAPPWCPLPIVDARGELTGEVLSIGVPGEQREWRGVVLGPGRSAR